MIVFAPGYRGFNEIRRRVEHKIGNLGEPQWRPLHIYGMTHRGSDGVSLSPNIGNAEALSIFLRQKLGFEVPIIEDGNIPHPNWISLTREMRQNEGELCMRSIIFSYAHINNLIRWI